MKTKINQLEKELEEICKSKIQLEKEEKNINRLIFEDKTG